jgi:hypothetical protein
LQFKLFAGRFVISIRKSNPLLKMQGYENNRKSPDDRPYGNDDILIAAMRK